MSMSPELDSYFNFEEFCSKHVFLQFNSVDSAVSLFVLFTRSLMFVKFQLFC